MHAVLDISFTLEEYQTSEADGEMVISVCKDKQTPQYPYTTVIVASTSHPDSPNRASKINNTPASNSIESWCLYTTKSYAIIIGPQDFDGRQHSLRFYGSRNCHHCHINITNDNINEANEVFIIQLTLANSLNPNLITLSRNTSIGVIADDDCKLDEIIK